ncbi:hypothetical protein [Hymenobacter nivis]|uniref:Uncharacterized protein n=1 Tax=Hymenobacter nivis TaxID=1850093 RepID=A0A502GVS9_9BACT|nr:hypothetical protein [Hymenobacter nivis]TPG66071.1 hypothetical protein EAH73_11925 [Hymenobacter nivis]
MSLARLDAIAAALKALPRLLSAATVQVVSDNTGVLELDNIHQLEEGLDADGRDITPEYTPFTVELKQEKGQPSDRVTLKDSGEFYRGLVARVRGPELEMVGTDEKTAELQQKYGDAVVGLSDESLDDFRETYVRPELEYKTREILGL